MNVDKGEIILSIVQRYASKVFKQVLSECIHSQGLPLEAFRERCFLFLYHRTQVCTKGIIRHQYVLHFKLFLLT